ncbi:MAG: MFS transporter [Clostridium sp.]|uniref:MFS transporter n=1 Tax=Clostridium sp. TaxID=1506 RepID=UPI0025C48C6F|nr:MFS transporter [Clostridium sp.]MCF0148557.1 MFS transporter [Clostridium sp.]
MLTLLLIIIYISFISLGLPDAILGSAWPMIHQDLNVPVSYAGIITIIISCGTIASSLFSEKIIRRLGTGKVTAFSVLLTAIGLLGVYLSPSFIWICFLAIPLGIGAGSVDSALNNFVALHYKAIHMNWLHSFWGLGATAGPLIMSIFLLKDNGWRLGYATIGSMQVVLVICLFLSLPLWKKFESNRSENTTTNESTKISSLIKVPGVKAALLSFFFYCSAELTTGLWVSSYLVIINGFSVEKAAKWVSLYYLGITIGRFLAGFVSIKLNNKQMIRAGLAICIPGGILLSITYSSNIQLIGLILIGLGFAPIFPANIHDTPNRFGKELSQGIIGIQMASAYVGTTFMPPLFGAISKFVGFEILPYLLLILMLLILVSTERINKVCKS